MTTQTTTSTTPQQELDLPPGWAIHANLMPPEVLQSRRLKIVRRGVFAALIVMVILVGFIYAAATYDGHRASNQLAEQDAIGAGLLAEEASFAEVTSIQTSIAQIKSQIASLMVGDVDFAKLLGSVRTVLPGGMTISEVQFSVSPTGTPSQDTSDTGGSLDTSGDLPIGVVTISGTSKVFSSVSVYVLRLKKLNGVADVVAKNNTWDGRAFEYSVSMTVTNGRLTDRYAVDGGAS